MSDECKECDGGQPAYITAKYCCWKCDRVVIPPEGWMMVEREHWKKLQGYATAVRNFLREVRRESDE